MFGCWVLILDRIFLRVTETKFCCCCPASLLQEVDSNAVESKISSYRFYVFQVPWTWLLGFCIFAIGNLFDFLALGISKQSVVTLVGSWALVVSCFCFNFQSHQRTWIFRWTRSLPSLFWASTQARKITCRHWLSSAEFSWRSLGVRGIRLIGPSRFWWISTKRPMLKLCSAFSHVWLVLASSSCGWTM